MARCEDRHALTERQARDEGHLPEPIAVLEQERRPVDLESLSMGGRRRRHARQYLLLAGRPGILGEAACRQPPGVLGEGRRRTEVGDTKSGIKRESSGRVVVGERNGPEEPERQDRYDERCQQARAERSHVVLPTLSAPTAASILPQSRESDGQRALSVRSRQGSVGGESA